MPIIESLAGREVLDSRGRPTVLARCTLRSGAVGSASVPSGASTGQAEAVERRDGDPRRYGGLGCRLAARSIAEVFLPALRSVELADQAALDEALLALDGTATKSRLGGNAILAVSLAFARAAAAERGMPLYAWLAGQAGRTAPRLPRPMVNLFSGGKHAGGQVSIQDVLLVPVAARSIDEALATVYDVYQAAAALVRERYDARALTADEGGLAPPFPDAETMLADAVEAIRRSGREPGREVALAVDVAASHFFEDGRYRLDRVELDGEGMVDVLAGWLDRYPLVSIEDGLAEEDWASWAALVHRTEGRGVRVVGDDLLCTSPERIERAIGAGAANALLLKVNQIGTLTEAARAAALARAAGWSITVSARSGETEDDWLADLAVGWGGDFIKVGSITRSERLAKYNRLLEIEAETGLGLAPN
ncbi:MAG TPA: enolase C-terminal domain-like protein [Longimicrobiaceae bacterium]